ncbi:ABC-2 type transport system ATP-binding protein [Eubacterium ruminantium]|nr:ABC-2 type transport system ATP-binding protein [Eubacterium ruminantium]
MENVLLYVDNLTFGYEDDPVIHNLSLQLREGEILHIEGKNGVGKTTLLKCIANIINGGKAVFIKGEELYINKNLARELSFVMSDDYLYDYMTMEENIVFFYNLFGRNKAFVTNVEHFIDLFGISEYKKKLVKNLSQGTRNKLYIAIMFSKEHSVLLLDEPFTALDKKTQEVILDYVGSYKNMQGKAVIMVTHIQQFKEIATRVFPMGGADN